jgi:hypothetical protein
VGIVIDIRGSRQDDGLEVFQVQAAFRRFQVRKQYLKILWSVGIFEKAILRWRLKRRGFRGLRGNPIEAYPDQRQAGDTVEDFYLASQKQAEEHIQRSVEQVQVMILSKTAQQEYRRMKMTHDQARVGDLHGDFNLTIQFG